MKRTLLQAAGLVCAMLLLWSLFLVGCNSDTPATDTPAAEAPAEEGHESHEGHNHDTPAAEGHTHVAQVSGNYRIEKAQDGTYTVTVTDKNGKALRTEKNLKNAPIVEKITDEVYSIGWATGTGPNDYKCLYGNSAKYLASEVFTSPLGCDGKRVAYPHAEKDGYAVTVQDVFDKAAYSRTHLLEDAYVGGDYTVAGGKLRQDGTVNVAYVINKEGRTRSAVIPLYDEEKK